MSTRRPHLWIAVASVAGVVLLAVVDAGNTSPGELTRVHQRTPELSSGGCSDCHGGIFGDMTSSCLDCHEEIDAQIQQDFGLHGLVPSVELQQCATCHSEHHGEDFPIVNVQSFLRAGLGKPEEFDHAVIGFEMAGGHLELSCAECHEHAETPVLPEEGSRYLGLSQDCATCHEDPHEGRMAVSCASCHGQEDFHQLEARDHDAFLPLVGGHDFLDCRVCHVLGDAHSLEAMGRNGARNRPRPADRTCAVCHESPHDEDFVRGAARLAGLTPATGCVDCHEAEHMSFREEGLEVTAEQHAFSGFALELPHDEVTCGECHLPRALRFELRYPGREADDCARCHEDPHGGQFQGTPFGPAGCIGCHAATHFEPHAFSLEQHALTALELEDSHVEAACEDCHMKRREDGPRMFRGTPSRCEVCHGDAHVGFFDLLLSGMEPVEHGDCARCHGATQFSDMAQGAFDHEQWTEFPILGAHAESQCESCHPRAEHPDDLGRSFGRVSEHFGFIEQGSSGCDTCHADPHAGEFDAPGLPDSVQGETGCARCHVESSFRAFPNGFDHLMWTGYPLLDAHADASCTDCHVPRKRPDEHGRTWSRVAGTSCAACHEDPHVGQFAVRGETDCRRCHNSAKRFSVLRFNHERDSRFPLGEAHADVACKQCHEPWPIGAGLEAVRYRPLDRECVDCHGMQESEILRKKRRPR